MGGGDIYVIHLNRGVDINRGVSKLGVIFLKTSKLHVNYKPVIHNQISNF